MSRQSRSSIWPFICVLACLFVLSATAPRLWEQRARERAERRAAAQASRAERLVAPAEAPPVQASGISPAPAIVEPSGALRLQAGVISPASAIVETPAAVPAQAAGLDSAPATDYQVVAPAERIASQVVSPPEQPDSAERASPAPVPEPVRVANRPTVRDAMPPVEPSAEPEMPAEETPLAPRGPASPAPAEVAVETSPDDLLWEEPAALFEHLDDLWCECETGCWAMAVERAVSRLGKAMSRGSEESADLLAKLARLRQDGDRLAAQLGDYALASKVRRACYALDRRYRLWEQTAKAGGLRAPADDAVDADPERLAICLGQVDALTQSSPEGRLWGQYLTLDALGQLAARRGQDDVQRRRQAARAVLDRLTQVRLNEGQRRFLTQPTMVALREELRRWATEPVEWATMLRDVERYEATGLPSDARRVAECVLRLALSPVAERRQLGEHLATHYRNANVRVAAGVDFLNRLIPERPAEYDWVDDCVLGKRVRGHSVTSTEVKVRLVPDPQKLRTALQIDGLVSSLTRSSSGPARFLNSNQSTYSAWKEVEIGREGMNVLPAQVCVHSDLRLRQLSTDFDGLPLVGAIVQEMARSGHESHRGEANAEIESKVYARAKEQVDAEADARLGAMARRIEERLMQPLADLSLGPKVISAETTDQRVVLRVRLAADDQLGGHTPRPMAPADCMASVQVHESALTNVVGRVQIDGGTFTLAELRRRIAERFNRPEAEEKDAEQEDVTFTFAPQNAARVRCLDGKVVLTVAVARLVREGQVYEDFQVRAVYTPQARGLSAELVRDDVIQLRGSRLNTRSQIALRGIFSKAFSKQKPWKLLPDRITQDPRMAGLAVTQLVVEDGWLGIALGRETATSPAVARRAGR